MRGVGWAICYLNPLNGQLSNHCTLHETGNVAGFVPILVMGTSGSMRSYWIIRHQKGRRISTPSFQTFTGRPWNNDSSLPRAHTRRGLKIGPVRVQAPSARTQKPEL